LSDLSKENRLSSIMALVFHSSPWMSLSRTCCYL